MNQPKFVNEVDLIQMECGTCGLPYAITEAYYNILRDTHDTFYCPKGHPRHYAGKSDKETLRDEVARLKRQIERKQKEKEWAEEETKNACSRERAQKAAKTRIKNRTAKGVCPCCNRHFQQLERHMKAKHPQYGTED